ncbi:MAG TPA: cation:proton antiporter family protein [Patescibacteria group bacterium]
MGSIFFELTLIICAAAILAMIFRFFKQPPMLAYILTGMLIIPFGIASHQNLVVLSNFSELGITLLLFLLGLEFNLAELKSIGKIAVVSALLQIMTTVLVSFLVSLLLGFSVIVSLYIGVALTFSSTIIVVKLLADKKDLHSLYGKISVGFLLVQDLFAIFFLMFIAGLKPEINIGFTLLSVLVVFLKGIVLFALIVYLSKTLLPKLLHHIARSEESLFLFSLAWVFGLSAIVSMPIIGFSIEIGGFLAGLALANAAENFSIVAKVRPLRDFFVTLFFVFLGSQLGIGNIEKVIIPAIILSVFVLVSKPIIMMTIMGIMKHRKRTSFMAGISTAQISEFSLIIIVLANKMGRIPSDTVTLITIVGIITFIFSTYFIMHSSKLYKIFDKYLDIFEWKKGKEEPINPEITYQNHIVLIGARRMGETILNTVESLDTQVVVIDFDPDVIKRLQDKNIPSIFGDIVDSDIQEKANIEKAKIIISTLTDIEDNILIIKSIRLKNHKAKIIVVAYDAEEAKFFYKMGVDYVVLPHIAGGRQIAKTLKSDELEKLDELREKDKKYLA